MQKKLFLLVFLFGFCACNTKEQPVHTVQETVRFLDLSKLPKKSSINAKAKNILKDWEAYNTFENGIDAIYKAENREDLLLTLDDVIEQQKALEEASYPTEFDIPQIKSRQKIIKTYLLKIKASLEDRTDIATPTVEMLEAYNAFRNQFNVTVNSALDPTLILDELDE